MGAQCLAGDPSWHVGRQGLKQMVEMDAPPTGETGGREACGLPSAPLIWGNKEGLMGESGSLTACDIAHAGSPLHIPSTGKSCQPYSPDILERPLSPTLPLSS